jgi:Pyruvate phosphate dikinase, AMP/ATP-binding domain
MAREEEIALFPLLGRPRSPLFRRRRRQRGGKLRWTAPHGAQYPFGSRSSWRRSRGPVVREPGLSHHLPLACRPFYPAQCRRCYANVAQAAVAGVMFTEHPVTGADERLIEASWGLGEAVVSGQVLERKVGRKLIAIRWLPNGGTFEQQVPPVQVNQLCLKDAHLATLGKLALRSEKVSGPMRDIEWAFQDRTLYSGHRRALHRATPLPPFNPSLSWPGWTGRRPSRLPACSRNALSSRARPSSWKAPGAPPSSSSTPATPLEQRCRHRDPRLG